MRFEHRAVPIAVIAMLIDSIGFGIVLPVLPSLIVELGKVPLAEATRIGGYMLAVYAVTHFFAGPVIGSLSDRFGRRRVLLASLGCFAVDYALMAAAPSLGWLFAGRAIAGIAGATYGPANAVIADVTPPEKRGAAFGLLGAAFGGGFILGPAIGGLLADQGARAPFFAAAGLAFVNMVLILAFMPETLPPERRRAFDWKRAYAVGAFAPLFQSAGASALLAGALVWQVAHMVYPSTWAFFAALALGWDAEAVGWSLAASGLAMMFAQVVLIRPAIRYLGEERTVLIGLASGAIVFAGYVFAREGWQIYALIAVGALTGLVFPSINALLSSRVDPSNQGALQGGMASLASIAAIVGPLAMTQALALGAERGHAGGAFLLAAILCLITFCIFLFGVVRRPGRLA
ncbi:MFS transporter, DHA1 family, tetracycline resistance protein [Sphingomonas sp. OV641]|uniref:MFS transporter n=1 Tax=Sphingomonas sp. OV641 TaxID=1881068 RepID=UPI0008C507B7|nr:MFS transporter [Sphingomonas sp. OV641]SEJ06079.1 MFS transporter, DHA1 family, tetracycline resistance protein [Sphingomonas sp. OV641]